MVFTPYPDFLIIYNSQDPSHSQRLEISSDYRKYYPTPLPQTAILRKLEGTFWTVKWTISQDETTSFEDGWSKFITDNDPMDGDFLLFSYDGSRTFFVSIFRDGLDVQPKAPVTIQEISDDDEAGGDDNVGDDNNMDKEEEGGNDQNMITSLSLGSSDEEGVDTTVCEVNKAPASLSEDDETSDDVDVDDGNDEDYKEEEEGNNQNMITSLSLGSSDEDDVDTTICEVNKANGSLKRASTSQRVRALSIGDPEMYLDDPKNPCFIASSSGRPMLVIAMQVIKDYDLKFGSIIKFIDGFGEVEGNLGGWKDRVVVYKWQEIYKRNDVKPEDVIICEILREGGVVRAIKPHFVKN